MHIEGYVELVLLIREVDICRDSDDNFLLALAKDGKANFLITGDKDFLALKLFEKTKIISLTNFFNGFKHPANIADKERLVQTKSPRKPGFTGTLFVGKCPEQEHPYEL